MTVWQKLTVCSNIECRLKLKSICKRLDKNLIKRFQANLKTKRRPKKLPMVPRLQKLLPASITRSLFQTEQIKLDTQLITHTECSLLQILHHGSQVTTCMLWQAFLEWVGTKEKNWTKLPNMFNMKLKKIFQRFEFLDWRFYLKMTFEDEQ